MLQPGVEALIPVGREGLSLQAIFNLIPNFRWRTWKACSSSGCLSDIVML